MIWHSLSSDVEIRQRGRTKSKTRSLNMRKTKPIAFPVRLPFCAALMPLIALAQPGLPLQGSFSISAEASPNTTGASFCGGAPTNQIVAQGYGTGFSTLGAFTFTLHKTLNLSTGEYRGCVVLTATDGDTLEATYDLVQPSSTSDFNTARGNLTITGGTGRFSGATGTLKTTAVFLNLYAANSFLGGGTAPLQVVANYVVDGTVSFARQ
jgi:hypothetical protein